MCGACDGVCVPMAERCWSWWNNKPQWLPYIILLNNQHVLESSCSSLCCSSPHGGQWSRSWCGKLNVLKMRRFIKDIDQLTIFWMKPTLHSLSLLSSISTAPRLWLQQQQPLRAPPVSSWLLLAAAAAVLAILFWLCTNDIKIPYHRIGYWMPVMDNRLW